MTLTSAVDRPDTWARQLFNKQVWGVSSAKSFWELFGKRVTDVQDGLSKGITLLINARPQQFRTFPLKAIIHNGVRQVPGTIDCLLVDGRSMSWQTAFRTANGQIDKNTVPYDLYFANGKRMRLAHDGTLAVTVEQDDTSVSIEGPLQVCLQLDVKGIADIANLLSTRGAKVKAPVKQSLPSHPADVSTKDATDVASIREPGIPSIGREKQVRQDNVDVRVSDQVKRTVTNGLDIKKRPKLAFDGTQDRTEIEQSSTLRQGMRGEKALPLHTRRTKEAAKSSKPEQDLRPISDASQTAECIAQKSTKQVHSDLERAQETSNPRNIQTSAVLRDSSDSLSPVPPEEQHETATRHDILSPDPRLTKQETDFSTSTGRRTPHTYGKSRAAKKSINDKRKLQQREERIEENESESESAGTKVMVEDNETQMPAAEKSRTGKL